MSSSETISASQVDDSQPTTRKLRAAAYPTRKRSNRKKRSHVQVGQGGVRSQTMSVAISRPWFHQLSLATVVEFRNATRYLYTKEQRRTIRFCLQISNTTRNLCKWHARKSLAEVLPSILKVRRQLRWVKNTVAICRELKHAKYNNMTRNRLSSCDIDVTMKFISKQLASIFLNN